jgi:ubiquinone/menaquinone biosynthesis C-methylase UbiE
LSPFKSKVSSVLEIGCSNGAKLEQICGLLDAKGQGIDPSQRAVDEGNGRLSGSGVELHVGTASRLPFDRGAFDVVYFGFCFYLLDRQDLFAAMAEADRVLKSGGFLAITDFDPIHRHKRPYHHKDGVFSFKQDYSRIFIESGLYCLVSQNSFSHRQPFFDADGNERVSTTLLFKEVDAY